MGKVCATYPVWVGKVCTPYTWVVVSMTRKYKLIDPQGKEYEVATGLEKFCKPLGLDRVRLLLVAQGKRSHCHGWKCYYLRADGEIDIREPVYRDF